MAFTLPRLKAKSVPVFFSRAIGLGKGPGGHECTKLYDLRTLLVH